MILGKTNPKTEASCKVQFNLILFIIKTIFCQFVAVVCLNDGVISTYSLGRYHWILVMIGVKIFDKVCKVWLSVWLMIVKLSGYLFSDVTSSWSCLVTWNHELDLFWLKVKLSKSRNSHDVMKTYLWRHAVSPSHNRSFWSLQHL